MLGAVADGGVGQFEFVGGDGYGDVFSFALFDDVNQHEHDVVAVAALHDIDAVAVVFDGEEVVLGGGQDEVGEFTNRF